MIEIDRNIWVETSFQGSNNSIVRTAQGLVLIDSPMRPSDAVAWRDIVGTLGEVRYLVNTDHHPDHTFGNGYLPGEIIAHRLTREIMEREAEQNGSASYGELLKLLDPIGCELYLNDHISRIPTVTFNDRMSLHLGDVDFELIHAPGHTLNTIIVHLPNQGVAFVGDAVCEAGIPSFVDANIFAWRETVSMIEGLDAKWLITGHGEVCGPEVVPVFRNELEAVIGEVEWRMDKGQAREQIVSEVTFEDRIHTGVNGWTSFPQNVLDIIITRSIERVYDDISRHRQALAAA